MIRQFVAVFVLLAAVIAPALADRVTVATTRDVQNGALFRGALRGF